MVSLPLGSLGNVRELARSNSRFLPLQLEATSSDAPVQSLLVDSGPASDQVDLISPPDPPEWLPAPGYGLSLCVSITA